MTTIPTGAGGDNLGRRLSSSRKRTTAENAPNAPGTSATPLRVADVIAFAFRTRNRTGEPEGAARLAKAATRPAQGTRTADECAIRNPFGRGDRI